MERCVILWDIIKMDLEVILMDRCTLDSSGWGQRLLDGSSGYGTGTM